MLPRVAEIVADVRERGDAALLDWTERLDGERPELRVPADQLLAAQLQPDELEAAARARRRGRRLLWATAPAGCRTRGGRGCTPSGAGSRWRRWVCTSPAAGRLSVLARDGRRPGAGRRRRADRDRDAESVRGDARRAHALGIDEVYSVGGAQAVAALAFGTETVAPVDKIVGPGNRWVTAAKLLVSSHVAIDLPAGPSEVVLIADASADPARCAADLLAQSEHGPDSEAILLSLDPDAFRGACATSSPGPKTSRFGTCATPRRGARASPETYAPEHLELWVEEPEPLARADPERGHGLRPDIRRRRRLRGRRDAHPCRPEAWREAVAGWGSRRS